MHSFPMCSTIVQQGVGFSNACLGQRKKMADIFCHLFLSLEVFRQIFLVITVPLDSQGNNLVIERTPTDP